MDSKYTAWLTIGIIAAMGGWVANIIVPERRGVLGFASAALIGVFCGGVAGIAAHACNASEATQYVVAAATGVLGDRVLSLILRKRQEQWVNIHNHNVGQQNIGQTGGEANADTTNNN